MNLDIFSNPYYNTNNSISKADNSYISNKECLYLKTKLDYYRVFYETARYGSFSLAADKLFISQSAISQCIHQLEKDLDTKLFHRSRRGVTLTQEGKMLLPKIENALSSINQGETLLAQFRHLHAGSLKIAAGDTAASFYGVLTRVAPSESGGLAQAFGDGVPSTTHFQGVIVKGYVAVKCAQGNPSRGGAVYMRVTAATGKNVGDFEAVADGANSVLLPGVIWAISYKDANDIAEIRIG